MRELPILMSAPMVRALLAGRKTVTRRVVKHPYAAEIEVWRFNSVSWRFGVYGEGGVAADVGGMYCPYGVEGDRLWVRETWGVTLDAAIEQGRNGLTAEASAKARYAAEGAKERFGVLRWRPSIHMPRWASRLTLEVTDVRIERLQAITEEDAVAEGALFAREEAERNGATLTDDVPSARRAFRTLWASINGPDSWAANPWVWRVAFRVVTP